MNLHNNDGNKVPKGFAILHALGIGQKKHMSTLQLQSYHALVRGACTLQLAVGQWQSQGV